ncbi:MAG: DNA methyltransferase [Chloroflexia bacterium]
MPFPEQAIKADTTASPRAGRQNDGQDPGVGQTIIENTFPVALISQLAEHESWRKEVYRPIYYMHKWWARRLGSVFRALILASAFEAEQDLAQLLYRPIALPKLTVFDPFMGSGTAVGEALKLGCRTIGRDINPVSALMVQAALQPYAQEDVLATFAHLATTCGEKIRALYQCTLPDGNTADVLYYFWVKVVPCPCCEHTVELFKRRIFAQHAVPTKDSSAKALCPSCRTINDVRYDSRSECCHTCGTIYNPQLGVAAKAIITCPFCGHVFKLIDRLRTLHMPLGEQMYAKLVLHRDGHKEFFGVDATDQTLYHTAETMLPALRPYIPQAAIQPGHNTNQMLNYNYRHWHQMFNARQLVSLALLATEIARIEAPEIKLLFACLLSGVTEFNNMFASFKGIGTGAVRPLFSHHILKPELMPLEANVWGTAQSSGAFSTLFRSRILPALSYKRDPFELQITSDNGVIKSHKIFGLSSPVDRQVVSNYPAFATSDGVYLSTGDSAVTDLPDVSVDLVLTDPPFFDNVHYSELADFFYVWLRQILDPSEHGLQVTTRSPREVQSADVAAFAGSLTAVFAECHRVLKTTGRLVFTYHHSRMEGWTAVYKAVRASGFYIVRAHPVKAEMAVSVPVQRAKSPINFDLVLVCRKNHLGCQEIPSESALLQLSLEEAQETIRVLRSAHVNISLGDIWVILMGCILVRLYTFGDLAQELAILQHLESASLLLSKELGN